MPDATHRFLVETEAGERLDHFLVRHLPDFTRSRLQSLIRDGLVLVNEVAAAKTGQMLENGQQVEVIIPAPRPSALQAESIPLDILYEDDQVVAVNKPAGMVVHPSAGHASGTLVHALLAHAPGMVGVGGEQRPGVVHRLDKDTSGVIILAKTDAAHQTLQKQFKDRAVEKWYLALVDGRPPTPEGRIEAPIGRDVRERQRMAITPANKGREAISEYHTQEEYPQHTLLTVKILTGRTHQIRVHLAFLGTPVVGDRVYGQRTISLPIRRQFLHSWKTRIVLPGQASPITLEAALPPELELVLQSLRR